MSDQNTKLPNQETDIAPKPKVWYIDCSTLSPADAQAMIEKLKRDLKGE